MIEFSELQPRFPLKSDRLIGYSEDKEVVIIEQPEAILPVDVVRYDSNNNLPVRGNIILNNDSKLLGTTTSNSQINLIECSRFSDDNHPIVDIGSTTAHVNISTVDRPTIQLQGEAGSHDHEIAFLADITESENKTNAKIESIETDINGLEGKVSTTELDITELQEKVSEQDTAINKAEQDISKLQTDVTGINTSIENIEGNITDINDEINLINDKVENVENEIGLVKDDITNIKNEITGIQDGYVKNGLNKSNIQVSSPIIQLNASEGANSGLSLAAGTITLSGQSINTTITGDINLTTSSGEVKVKGNPILSDGEGRNFLSDNGTYLPVVTDENFDETLNQHFKDAQFDNVSLQVSGNMTQTAQGNVTITSGQTLSLNGTTVQVNGSPVVTQSGLTDYAKTDYVNDQITETKALIPTKTSDIINDSGFITSSSNVASATKLQNSRTIWGQNFDGTGDISGPMSNISTITSSGAAFIGGSVYCGGKTAAGDGKAGVVIGGGGDLNVVNSGNPIINFYNNLSTSPTNIITSTNNGISLTSNVIAPSFNSVNIINSGTGTNYLSDDGSYKELSTPTLTRIANLNADTEIIPESGLITLSNTLTIPEDGYYVLTLAAHFYSVTESLSSITSTRDLWNVIFFGLRREGGAAQFYEKVNVNKIGKDNAPQSYIGYALQLTAGDYVSFAQGLEGNTSSVFSDGWVYCVAVRYRAQQ